MSIRKKTKITPAESEICNIFMEECAESIQAVSKIFRFGFDSCHPDVPNFNNREHLQEEIGDLICMVKIMCDKGIISDREISRYAEAKMNKLRKFSNIELD